ncbi:MAG TPA: ImmA/IrrE family metallo-endopeptidase [Phenylobacterium sp.]|jgi:hypothetical protein|uniref:ImmA/IrrE family metallo-endopeptidase n=1 Tax=Phenylobacterium sp. TaxID=1871053 RepID=UPI002B54A069|nr:ImmA/IrrE family metallo-endopeptidase [Phenylobacterium sp.]HXA40011.1 ImmA/IrrE family metallo-endopeptidase [Phenylobacterium sp.]
MQHKLHAWDAGFDSAAILIEQRPEVALARRLIALRGLSPPIDVEALVREYAELHIIDIPFDFDGFCINLKVPKRIPKVIVNSRRSALRLRFTLAHELGHLLIPWHVGTVVDEIDIGGYEADYEYVLWEAEANRFASELLMPADWVASITHSSASPPQALDQICSTARVSRAAGILKLMQFLSPGYVFARVEAGVFVESSRSQGTISDTVRSGTPAIEDPYPYATDRWSLGAYRWWRFGSISMPRASDPTRKWQEVLSEILHDVEPDPIAAKKLQGSINGIVSSANSAARFDRDADRIYGHALQRFHAHARTNAAMAAVLEHPLRDDFLALRVAAFLR